MWVFIGTIWVGFLILRTLSSAELNNAVGLGNHEGSVHKLWRIGLWRLAMVPLLYAIAYKLTGRKRPGKPDYLRISALEAELWPPLPEPEPPPPPKPVRRVPVLSVETYGPLGRMRTVREVVQAQRGPARAAPFTPRAPEVIYVDARTRHKVQ